MNFETKRVRAYNVRPGDELPMLDTKRLVEKTAVALDAEHDFFGDGAVTLRFRFKRGRVVYHWKMKRTALVRVRRALKVAT